MNCARSGAEGPEACWKWRGLAVAAARRSWRGDEATGPIASNLPLSSRQSRRSPGPPIESSFSLCRRRGCDGAGRGALQRGPRPRAKWPGANSDTGRQTTRLPAAAGLPPGCWAVASCRAGEGGGRPLAAGLAPFRRPRRNVGHDDHGEASRDQPRPVGGGTSGLTATIARHTGGGPAGRPARHTALARICRGSCIFTTPYDLYPIPVFISPRLARSGAGPRLGRGWVGPRTASE